MRICFFAILFGGALALAQADEPGHFRSWIQAVEMAPLAESREEQDAGSLMWIRRGEIVSGAGHNEVPLRSVVSIPQDGTYTLWARYEVHPTRRKTFSVEIQGQQLPFATESFGKTPEDRPEIYQGREPDGRLIWTSQTLDLQAGEQEVILSADCEPPNGRWTEAGHPPVVEALVLTNDSSFDPATE